MSDNDVKKIIVSQNELIELIYTGRTILNDLVRLRKEARIMREKLFLVEGMLQLRHLQGPGYGDGPDDTGRFEKLLYAMEYETTRASQGRAEK